MDQGEGSAATINQNPDPHPDPHQGDKSHPDPHQSYADPQQCLEELAEGGAWSFSDLGRWYQRYGKMVF
jgi:hypothetical protein